MLRKKKQTPQEQSDQEFNLALEVPAEQRPKGWRPFVRRNWKRIAAAACAAAVAGAFLLPGNGAKPAGVDTEYLESAVERRNITNVFSGSGTIAAANTYTVNALVSGTVLTADFAVGDTIEEGTVLYTIDSSNAANSAEKAQLSLDQASAITRMPWMPNTSAAPSAARWPPIRWRWAMWSPPGRRWPLCGMPPPYC